MEIVICLSLGAEEITDVEESMRSVTERWLLIEEMIKQRSVTQQEVDRVTKVKDHDNEILSILNMKIELSNQEQKNEHTLSFLKVKLFEFYACCSPNAMY